MVVVVVVVLNIHGNGGGDVADEDNTSSDCMRICFTDGMCAGSCRRTFIYEICVALHIVCVA